MPDAVVWAPQLTCVYVSAGVWYCVSEATCSVSERQGRICHCVHLCVSVFPRTVCVCVSAPVCVCVWWNSQRNCGTARQPLRQRGRGVKEIKHKPTNHRRRLISAVLKGEPGTSDESLLWISPVTLCRMPPCILTGHREGKVQREPPLIWPCCNLIIRERRGKVALDIAYQRFSHAHRTHTQTLSQPNTLTKFYLNILKLDCT